MHAWFHASVQHVAGAGCRRRRFGVRTRMTRPDAARSRAVEVERLAAVGAVRHRPAAPNQFPKSQPRTGHSLTPTNQLAMQLAMHIQLAMQLAFEFFNLRQMDQEKSPRTQLCVKRLVVLERREFTVGLLTALYIS